MEIANGKFKIVSFGKCSCCNDCYFFIMDDRSTIGIVPVYSKAGASLLLETCKIENDICERDFQFFVREIACSTLPENTDSLDGEQKRRHLRKPEVYKTIQGMVHMLIMEYRNNQSAQRLTH